MPAAHFIEGDLIAFDSETTGLHAYGADEPFAFSFTNEIGHTVYFEFDVDPFTRKVRFRQRSLDRMERLFWDKAVATVGHNLKFDVCMMERACKIKLRGPIHETMFAAHICNSNERNFGLKPLSQKYLKISRNDEKALLKCVAACRIQARKLGWKLGPNVKTDYWMPRAFWRRLDDPDQTTRTAARLLLSRFPNLKTMCRRYCTKDTRRTMILHLMYQEIIDRDNLPSVYEREIKLWPIVYAMEKRGVRISMKVARAESRRCARVIRKNREIMTKAFGPFNKKVPDTRLRQHLFGKGRGCLGLKVNKGERTAKTRQPMVGRAILRRHVKRSPALAAVIEHDKHLKAKGTYFDNYTRMAVRSVIHCSFTQIGPVTGRFACRSPNLQNVPKRALEGDVMRRVRRPFRPRRGYVWLHFDFKSIEARIFAECAGEEDMLRIFREGGDVYVELVKRVAKALGWSVKRLDKVFKASGGARQVCKNNFLGWTYGEGVKKMAKSLGLPLEIAEKVIAALQEAYPLAMPFMEEMQGIASRDKLIINRYERRVPIPRPAWVKDPETGDVFLARFEYKAVNYLIQSTAADLLKEAMIRLAGLLSRCGRDAHLVMTIHDELVVECAIEDVTPKFIRQIERVMSDNQGMFTEVETPVDVKITTRSWDEPIELKDYLQERRKVAA